MLPLFISDVPLQCINQAADTYHIPAKLIIAILNVERGKAGMAIRNKNGSYDLGPMQINTAWWPTLYRHGITPQQVRDNVCLNVAVGSWILAKNIAEAKDVLTGVGDYHSHTIVLNYTYTYKVRLGYTRLMQWLQQPKQNGQASLT